MNRTKRILKALFCLPPVLTLLVALPAFGLVTYVLVTDTHPALSLASYILSAYALTITVTGTVRLIRGAKTGFAGNPLVNQVKSSPWGRKLLADAVFRSEVGLHGGFFINFLYAGLKLFYGLRYRSAWFMALAGYYALLCAMRGKLVLYVRKTPVGEDLLAEFRCYRGCGILLALMNIALAGMVGYMVHQDRGASYPGLLIYAMAAYTFYITIAAVVNAIRYRRHARPILAAAKIISLTAALVSMLSLENAMIRQFGANQHTFQQTMTSAFGGAICVTVLGMAMLMILRANRNIRELSQQIHNKSK